MKIYTKLSSKNEAGETVYIDYVQEQTISPMFVETLEISPNTLDIHVNEEIQLTINSNVPYTYNLDNTNVTYDSNTFTLIGKVVGTSVLTFTYKEIVRTININVLAEIIEELEVSPLDITVKPEESKQITIISNVDYTTDLDNTNAEFNKENITITGKVIGESVLTINTKTLTKQVNIHIKEEQLDTKDNVSDNEKNPIVDNNGNKYAFGFLSVGNNFDNNGQYYYIGSAWNCSTYDLEKLENNEFEIVDFKTNIPLTDPERRQVYNPEFQFLQSHVYNISKIITTGSGKVYTNYLINSFIILQNFNKLTGKAIANIIKKANPQNAETRTGAVWSRVKYCVAEGVHIKELSYPNTGLPLDISRWSGTTVENNLGMDYNPSE